MYLFDFLSNNAMFLSGAFLLNMFGGRMMFQDIQPYLNKMKFLKYVFIFCLFFIATKDINISLILIVTYVIFMQFMIDFKNQKEHSEGKSEEKNNDAKIDSCIDLLNDIKNTS